ncbi:methyltransferase domain-containing protein [Anabaena sp. UHCC 0253]|uniref:methyltransferase domain-containing protein n=1 Tax=Anabaena sp. UHCC 0253 TaxID=2590019 RepID=UPI001C2C3A1F|nr:methyltransferase domain-containing protein [Anabaena sp. UHCC 0253]MTJ55937.1 methyltransferase domain-containing protein [Anabaena sp. UHCC 0253]
MMLAQTLIDCRCPKCKKGSLTLDESILPVISKDVTDGQEIQEALLHCEYCNTLYPVVAGVAILVPNPLTYVAKNYSLICSLASQYISSLMFDYWSKHLGIFSENNTSSMDWNYDDPLSLSLYIFAHYDKITEFLDLNHPLRKLVDDEYGDWYERLLNLAKPYLRQQPKVLDIGCNVGGLIYRLAYLSQFVYGLDYSFGSVFTARCILLAQPCLQNIYHLHIEGVTYQERPISVERPNNVDIVVASAGNIPFELKYFDLVTAINLIDVIPNPDCFLDNVDSLLKNQGIFLTTDPYYWETDSSAIEQWIGGRPNMPSNEAMRTEVSKRFNLLEEQDIVPWVLRVYERHYRLYFNHHLVAQKR